MRNTRLTSRSAVVGYYKRSVTQMVSLIHELGANPWAEGSKCLSLQMELLKKIRYVENKMRVTKAEIKSVRAALSGYPSLYAGKIRTSDPKRAMLAIRSKLDGYKQVLHILKDVGDALAFTYVDKYDIKPMRFKEASGFVSGKAGLRKECQALRRVFKLGGIGILNDLTHCLRYGDIVAGHSGSMFAIVEVKSGRNRNQRARRQSAEIAKIADYLETDSTCGLYGIDGEFRRFAVKGNEQNHRNRLNVIIRKARRYGLSWEEVERGLFYVVTYESSLDWMKSVGRRCKGQPMLAIINELKWENLAYYPFTLSISDPTALWEFYTGKMIIVIVTDAKVLEDRFISAGLSVELLDDEDFIIRLFDRDWQARGVEAGDCKISRKFFTRLFGEFLGLEWMCAQIINLHGATSSASSGCWPTRPSETLDTERLTPPAVRWGEGG